MRFLTGGGPGETPARAALAAEGQARPPVHAALAAGDQHSVFDTVQCLTYHDIETALDGELAVP